MSGRSKRGPKNKKKASKKKEGDKAPPSLAIVGGGKKEDTPSSNAPKVRPLPPDKEIEWLIAEAEEATLRQRKIANGLEQQLLERDETILGLRKEIVSLRASNLHDEEVETHSKNKAILASLDLKEGECVMRIAGKLTIGPASMLEGEKKSG